MPTRLERTGLYERLSEKDIKEGRKGRSTFDIVAGTSIGAINAAVLVGYVVENQITRDQPRGLLNSELPFQRINGGNKSLF